MPTEPGAPPCPKRAGGPTSPPDTQLTCREMQSPSPSGLPPRQERTHAKTPSLLIYSLRSPSLWILQGLIGLSFFIPQMPPLHSAFLQKGCKSRSRSPSALKCGTCCFLPGLAWCSTTEGPLCPPPLAAAPHPSLRSSPDSHEQEPCPSLGHAKPRVPHSPSSCSPTLWRGSAQPDKTEQPSVQGRTEDFQCLRRRSHRHPSPAPSPRLPPQSGERLGWWPQGDLAAGVSIQLGFRS